MCNLKEGLIMMKIIAVTIICLLLIAQFVTGVRESVKKQNGCLGITMFTVWTLFLLALLYFAGCFTGWSNN